MLSHGPIAQLATADTWFRTCRTSSFCTVAWQLARFQLTRRIARSLGDSWVSCWWTVGTKSHGCFPIDVYRYCIVTHTRTRLTALCPGLPGWAGTRKVNHLDFTEAIDSEWQWHQLGHMQVCTSLQTDNHASTPPLSFLQAGCNSVKAL